MVANYPSDTGYAWWLMEHFWKTLSEWIHQRGAKAYLAYPKIISISATIQSAPIQLVELTLPWQSKKQAKEVQDFLRSNEITAIYFTDQDFFKLQYIKLRINGIRRIIIHDHTPGDRPAVGGIKGAIKAIRNSIPWCTADNMLCVSELMRHRDIANGRIPSNKCLVVQNGIPPVKCVQESGVALRKDLDIKLTSIVVVTSGRAHPYKRFDFIIKCANFLKNLAPEMDVVFLLVGDGSAMHELKDMVRDLGLEKSVRLLGFRSDVHEILCASDIALHAALGEGFSLAIIEYMSAGLPVLVPDIPSVSQAIKHDETGVIYPRDDIEAVANHIKALALDNERRLEMGKAAKNKATDTYTLDRCTKEFIFALNSIWAS